MNRIHRDRFGRITIVSEVDPAPTPEVEHVEPVENLEHDDAAD